MSGSPRCRSGSRARYCRRRTPWRRQGRLPGSSGRSGGLPAWIPTSSGAERLDHQARCSPTRVLLLARDQIAVAHGVRLEATTDDEVGVLELLGLVLDPERLDLLSDEVVREALFGVGEAGPGLPFHEQAPIREARLEQHARRVADHRGDLAGLVEGGDERVHALVVEERVHRALAADEEHSVVLVDANAGNRL